MCMEKKVYVKSFINFLKNENVFMQRDKKILYKDRRTKKMVTEKSVCEREKRELQIVQKYLYMKNGKSTNEESLWVGFLENWQL